MSLPENLSPAVPKKGKRTRSGCLNCRRKKRKCDESRPICTRCARVGAACEWGVRVTFLPVNSISSSGSTPWASSAAVLRSRGTQSQSQSSSQTSQPSQLSQLSSPDSLPGGAFPCPPDTGRGPFDCLEPLVLSPSAASETGPSSLYLEEAPPTAMATLAAASPIPPTSHLLARSTFAPPPFDDSLFQPSSTYLGLHAVLRDHLIREGRSNGPTRAASPVQTHLSPSASPLNLESPAEEDDDVLVLSEAQEYTLLLNWVMEVASWLDKFDNERRFQYALSFESKTHRHLKYAIMAVSARQMERRRLATGSSSDEGLPSSLALYQQAIHLLLPLLPTRSTAVIASCVVLCVLEMLSCAPQAWRQHLDGCATLLQAVGIHGFTGGVQQALFWCFARMDVCGGLISTSTTLIPVARWTPHGTDLHAAVRLFRSFAAPCMHANHAVFLLAHVIDLLAAAGPAAAGTSVFPSAPRDDRFVTRWRALWSLVDDWYRLRPQQMLPVFTASRLGPFPTVLFSSPEAISGNQMYHTAALLLLQHQPPAVVFAAKPRPVLWHARHIMGISNANTHHGCWTNSLQPIWLAGRLFSSPDEHRTILALLDRIERETGWATKWRADDLREWWGDLEDE